MRQSLLHTAKSLFAVCLLCAESWFLGTQQIWQTLFLSCVRGLAHGKHEALGIQAVSRSDYSFIKSKAAIVEVHL